MNWFVLAILAYFTLALVNVADKFILEKVIPGPKTYMFLVGVTGLAVLVLAPWFLAWPGWSLFFFNWLVGAFFAGALFFLYRALKGGEATSIMTLIGGLMPIFVVLLSLSLFEEQFTFYQWLGIAFLIFGTIIISTISVHHNIWFNIRKFFHLADDYKFPSIISAVIAALLFAFFWVGSKMVFNTQAFWSGFIWIRIGTFLTVAFLLVSQSWRREIFAEIKKSGTKKNNQFIYLGTQATGALGNILQNYAIALGSVALVSALQGLQYAFLLILTAFLTVFFPKVIKEDYGRERTIKKLIAIACVALGVFFLAI